MPSSFGVLPCDVPVLDVACDLWQYLRKKYGEPTGQDADVMIAATAIHHHMGVVTKNVGDFQRIPDLRVENWAEL
jgi:tRNA(fMet)-specific endonuclease VapC